jgi:hypothetical protein
MEMHNRNRTSGVSNMQNSKPNKKSCKYQRYDLVCLMMQRKEFKQTADPTHAKCHNHAARWL